MIHRNEALRRLPDVNMETIISMTNGINWNGASSHKNSIISPISKVLMLLERIHNNSSFRDLARNYNVSHTTCWRMTHDTSRLIEEFIYNN